MTEETLEDMKERLDMIGGKLLDIENGLAKLGERLDVTNKILWNLERMKRLELKDKGIEIPFEDSSESHRFKI